MAGRAAPTVLCDHCGYGIDDAETAWYQWLEGLSGPVTGEIFFLHKVCVDPFEADHPPADDQMWANMELACFPIYLGNYLQLDWDAAQDLAESMGRGLE
jgi:hypothetical protein